MGRVSIKGVLIGAITDTVASMFMGILVGVIVVLVSHITGIPREVIHKHGILYQALVMNGLSFSILGGFLAAYIAKHDELLNGGLSSFLCVLIGVLFIMTGVDHHSIASQLVLLFAGPACAVLGGYLRLRQKDGSICI